MAKDLFTQQEQQQIVAAVKEAELNTSGEIKVHIENRIKKWCADIFGSRRQKISYFR